ncbi:hypothetical protein VPHK251G3_0060 [Vibrio phage K251 g3]
MIYCEKRNKNKHLQRKWEVTFRLLLRLRAGYAK